MAERGWNDSDVDDIITSLKNMGINCLALDFDKTLISLHTESRWNRDAYPLISAVRPIFSVLVPKAVEAGFRIIVVTFSAQVKLVREVLAAAFPTAGEIVVRGNDGSWSYAGAGSTDGKQAHLASAFEELAMKLGGRCSDGRLVTRATTLLIDDDPANIHVALLNETPAILLNPNDPESELVRALKTLPPAEVPVL